MQGVSGGFGEIPVEVVSFCEAGGDDFFSHDGGVFDLKGHIGVAFWIFASFAADSFAFDGFEAIVLSFEVFDLFVGVHLDLQIKNKCRYVNLSVITWIALNLQFQEL